MLFDPSLFDDAPCITTVPPKEGKSLRSNAVFVLFSPPALVPAAAAVVVVDVPLAVPPGADDVSVTTAALPKPLPMELDVLENPPAPPSKRSDMPFVGFC